MSDLLLLDKGQTFRAKTLSVEDARLLRRMKMFLTKHGYREGLFCDRCGVTQSGTHASVTDRQIKIECRCTRRIFSGASY